MKFRVTFKTPDALDYALEDIGSSDGVEPEEAEDLKQEVKSFASEYIEYGEYITVEFDTEKKTAVAVKLK